MNEASMRAAVLTRYGAIADALEFRDIPIPRPRDNEVQIEVQAFAVNDWEWGLIRGKPVFMRLLGGLPNPRVTVPGVEVAGHVAAVGRDVTQLQAGDRVYSDLSDSGFGGFAEYVCAPESSVTLMPEGMSYTDGAAMPHAAGLALQGLCELGELAPGQSLLINGAGGGVGVLGVQIARAIGAAEITGVDSAAKLETMRSLGFDHVIDYATEDFTRSGRRYDLILDNKTTHWPFSYGRVLNPGGKYISVGGFLTRIAQIALFGPIIRRVTGKTIRVLALEPNARLDYANELFSNGKLEPLIDGPYTFADLIDVIERFGNARHQGKVVVVLKD